MGIKENKEVVRRFVQVLQDQDYDALDEITTPNCVVHRDGSDASSSIDIIVKHGNSSMHVAFPDISYTIDQIIAEDDMVAVKITWKGTHLGKFRNTAPTGVKVSSNRMATFHIVQGKIVEFWMVSEMLGLYQQLGEIPPTLEIGK